MAENPRKLYYSIKEVAQQSNVTESLLRYWETEFPHLRPKTTGNRVRQYTEKDIETYSTLHNLKRMPDPVKVFFKYRPDHEIERISSELESVITDLSNTRDAPCIRPYMAVRCRQVVSVGSFLPMTVRISLSSQDAGVWRTSTDRHGCGIYCVLF